jgi:hypothetical protein
MKSSQQVSPQQTSLPAVIPIVGTLKHSLRKVVLARLEAPNQACGVAQRVGYTGTRETDLAIYRLRVRQSPERQAATLPGFFVLEDGIFLACQDAPEVAVTNGEPGIGSA